MLVDMKGDVLRNLESSICLERVSGVIAESWLEGRSELYKRSDTFDKLELVFARRLCPANRILISLTTSLSIR